MYTPMVRCSSFLPLFPTHIHKHTHTQELQNLPCFPSEILPLFLYLGDHRHAYNASLNYDLKLHHHIRLAKDQELPPAFPESTNELHINIEDTPQADLASRFEEITEFIGEKAQHLPHTLHYYASDFVETHRKKSERVLVYCELGISQAATAVIAYLIKRNHCSLKVSPLLQAETRPVVLWETNPFPRALAGNELTTHFQHLHVHLIEHYNHITCINYRRHMVMCSHVGSISGL